MDGSLDSVDLVLAPSDSASSGASTESFAMGSSSSQGIVHSWVDGNVQWEGYGVTIYIHGPAGVPYR